MAPWHYPCILHQVIERPESVVGGLDKGGYWAESSSVHAGNEKTAVCSEEEKNKEKKLREAQKVIGFYRI